MLPDDDPLLSELRLGLDDDAARVLAYLVGRRESAGVEAEEATRLALRVGTGPARESTPDRSGPFEAGRRRGSRFSRRRAFSFEPSPW